MWGSNGGEEKKAGAAWAIQLFQAQSPHLLLTQYFRLQIREITPIVSWNLLVKLSLIGTESVWAKPPGQFYVVSLHPFKVDGDLLNDTQGNHAQGLANILRLSLSQLGAISISAQLKESLLSALNGPLLLDYLLKRTDTLKLFSLRVCMTCS